MNYYLLLAIILFFYMNLWFLISLIRKRNDVVDIAWGLGFVVMAWLSYFFSKEMDLRPFLINFLITIWGLRLALHIYIRNRGKKEDYRYKEMKKGGIYFKVYILQGIFLYIIVLPLLFINKNIGSFNAFDLVGFIIWIIGFSFEAIADYQLSKFIGSPNNRDKVLRTGLWKYSRHPNYFGEVLQWWGIYIFALTVNNGLFMIVSPLLITILILFVSGIPLLEKKLEQNPEFGQYKKETSVFFPLPQKKL